MKTFPPEAMHAVGLLGVYTGGSYRLWNLCGNSQARNRAAIMAALIGRKATQRESGITLLTRALYEALEIDGDCEAARHANLIIRCRGIMTSLQPDIR